MDKNPDWKVFLNIFSTIQLELQRKKAKGQNFTKHKKQFRKCIEWKCRKYFLHEVAQQQNEDVK